MKQISTTTTFTILQKKYGCVLIKNQKHEKNIKRFKYIEKRPLSKIKDYQENTI